MNSAEGVSLRKCNLGILWFLDSSMSQYSEYMGERYGASMIIKIWRGYIELQFLKSILHLPLSALNMAVCGEL